MAKTHPAGGTPATDQLAAAGVAFVLHSYQQAGSGGFGREAAEKLGVDPRRIFKTLLVEAAGRLAVGIVPVADRLDLKAIARVLGAKRADLATAARAERSSGYVLGGISPFGQRTLLPTVLDGSAERFATILVSAGRRGLDVEVAPRDLVRLLGAQVARIGFTGR